MYFELDLSSHCFHLMFIFVVCWKAVLSGLLMISPPPLCLPPPNPFLQITVSLAQGYERTPSSPKPRFKSYAYTQAAYVSTSDPKRSPFPSQVCQHLLSVLQTKNFIQDNLTWLLFVRILQCLFSPPSRAVSLFQVVLDTFI